MKKHILIWLFFFLFAVSPLSVRAEETFSKEQDLVSFFRTQKEAQAETITFTCTPKLYESLVGEQTRLLRRLGVQGGIEEMCITWYDQSCRIELSELVYTDAPWVSVKDADQFYEAVAAFSEEETEAFNILFEPAFYETLSEEEDKYALNETSALNGYYFSWSDKTAAFFFTDVSYLDSPCLICRTEQDVADAISEMGEQGVSEFRLYLYGETLREALMGENTEPLRQLEVQGRLSTASISMGRRRIFYYDAHITPDAPVLTTLREAADYVAEMAEAGESEIPLFCEKELYDALMKNKGKQHMFQSGVDPFDNLLYNAGIMTWNYQWNDNRKTILVTVHSRYAGLEILCALEEGWEDALSNRLKETLESAKRLAEESAREDPRETARAIHDALCARIVYTIDDEISEDDCAIGALLDGKANCDGYSDAFYLTGTLAGLEIRYLYGSCHSRGILTPSKESQSTHMWNLIFLNGSWHVVDVTKDDLDNDHVNTYTFFDIGEDRASRSHDWNREICGALLEETDLTTRPENEYIVLDEDDVRAAVAQAFAQGQDHFTLVFDRKSYKDYEKALEIINGYATDTYHYNWHKKMRELRIYL